MLSVWKRSWKEKDPPADGHQDMLDGLSSSVSSLDSTAAAHPSNAALAPTTHFEDSGLGRRRAQESVSDNPPRKRVRFNTANTPLFNIEDLLEQSRRQNTIVILRPEQATTEALAQLIISSVDVESLPVPTSSTVKRRRTALLVVKSVIRKTLSVETLCRMTPETSVAQHKKNGDPEPWSYLLRTDITITTPESLLSSFGSGELDMNQVQLLIFTNVGDSQGHLFPIVQKIMKSFYMVTDRLSRPRILGFLLLSEAHMTSFVASELEGLMDSKVLQIYGYELTDISQEHPAEVVLLYEKAPPGLRSTLADKLLSIASSDWFLSKHLSDSQAVFDEVGSCAGDLFWRRAFRESDAQNENSRNTTASGQDRLRNGIKNWGFSLPNLDPTSLRFNVSHKFLALVKALESCEPYGEAFRGIVLVELQSVALAIADMLRILDGSTLSFRPLSLHPNATSPIRRQEISRLFAAGVYNILILPKLDNSIHAPHTSVIISFNAECLKIGKDVDQAQPAFVIHLTQNNSEVLRSPVSHGEQRPESQTIEYADGVDLFASIQDPTTGSRLYLRDSVVAAERLTSIGQLNGVKIDQVLFSYEERMDALGAGCIFSCTVTIPRLLQLTGPPLQTKLDAKRAACFKFCQHLFSLGLLDCRFFPPPKLLDITSHDFDKQQNPKEPNATGPRRYSRKEPEFWRNTRTIPIAMLYPIIISTTAPDIDKQPYAPLAILTRQPLPDLASFNVFHSGIPTVVSIKRGAPLQIDQTQLNDIYSYTLRVCRTVSNKPFQCSSANMVYFFVPLKSAWASSGGNDPASPFNLPSIANCIPWDLVQLAGSSFNAPLKTGSLEETERDLKDAVIQDRSVEFTRRYAAVRLRPDLSPLSKPLDSPREAAFDSLLEFTKTRRKDFEELQDVNQPLVEVITIPAVLNQLNPTSRPAPLPKTHAKYLIPELCSKSTIPASVLNTARLLPSITRRIDEFLLIKELNAKLFDHKILDVLLHMSVCTPSCGVEYNYERLELLGDAFLKFMSSTYLFVTRPAHKEGSLHDARQDLISNKSLYRYACQAGVANYIQSKLFSPKLWIPPFFTPLTPNKADDDVGSFEPPTPVLDYSKSVQDAAEQSSKKKKKKKRRKRGSDERAQWLGDKAVADVAEAMLAAGYLTGGQETALQVAKALGIPILGINTWADFAAKGVAAPLNLSLKRESTEGVEAIIGYKVAQPRLLAQALTHSSVVGHDSTFTERLEFIGDAILDFMVIRHLYDREQQLTPGGLTLLKGAMVSNSTLAAVCVCSGLYKHFYHKSHPLQTSIRDYVAKLEISRDKEYQNAESEGRLPGQFWLEIAIPKALSDIVESVMGAVYVGDNFSLEGVEKLFENLLKPFYDKHITLKTLSHHPTKLLFELFQSQGCRRFTVQNDGKGKKTTPNIVQVVVHDITLASAEDPDPGLAARRASLFALDALEGDPGFFARTCDCRINTMAKDKGPSRSAEQMEAEDNESEDGRVANEPVAAEILQESDIEEGMIVE